MSHAHIQLGRLIEPCCAPMQGVEEQTHHCLDELSAHSLSHGWAELYQIARPALLPIILSAPYLAGLMRRDPDGLKDLLSQDPEHSFNHILSAITDPLIAITEAKTAFDPAHSPHLCQILRQQKAKLHLLCALCDLGQVWRLDQVTGALSRFADACTQLALALALAEAHARGQMTRFENKDRGLAPGLFILAMGKHGAFELNYSSDIDITFFCDLEKLPLSSSIEAEVFVDRLAKRMTAILSEKTVDGYVFRVDLRLRPDPSSTPSVVPIGLAMHYYESVGQNWERAAFIKARPIAGDMIEAAAFMEALTPFVWRRSLDYPAIADVHSIKRQIHTHKVDERLDAPGANLKLGTGGIREIEFFAQTQQLILGGRNPLLRSRRTIEALDALRRAGHLAPAVAKELKTAYARLRSWEHRVQMLNDEQTHALPVDDQIRARVGILSGFANLSRFDLAVTRTLRQVNGHYGALFSEDEPLSSAFGSLVFTGVDDDPETIRTLEKLGFDNPKGICQTIRSWHHGRIAATRSERGRELFTRLVPRLLDAVHDTGNANSAFLRFSQFFANLNAGVQIQSLFLANPKLFKTIVEIMGFAPRLANQLSRYPTSFDAMLDASFFEPLGEDVERIVTHEAEQTSEALEDKMNALRRVGREQQFRIGMQVISGRLDVETAGAAYTRLADTAISLLAPYALLETQKIGGHLVGQVCVIALGKMGSQEMTARSDLDLMILYLPDDPSDVSSLRSWAPETFYSRFTQKLIAALSVPTHEGRLYEIDMKLRPTGAKGPVAVSLASFENYYTNSADTWEFQAMTRARVIWASSQDFADLARLKIETIVRSKMTQSQTAQDVLDMRALLLKERPARSFWDFKRSEGGQVEAEFCAQYLQLVHARHAGPLRVGTLAALSAMLRAGLAPQADLEALILSWRVQQTLSQYTAVCLEDNDQIDDQPEAFQRRLCRAVNTRRLDTLEKRLSGIRQRAAEAFHNIVKP